MLRIKSKKFGEFLINEENMHLFWYFVTERQNVYYNRFIKKIPPPWTEDKILQEFKFTNVHRSLDRTTIWYHENIGKFKNEKDIVFATFVHRLFNRIETMEKILPLLKVKTFDHGKMMSILKELRKTQNVFTSAHLVTGNRFMGSPDKLENILYLVDKIHKEIDSIFEMIKNSTSLENLYENTRRVNGFGPFLGYQFILDMINCGICKFSHNDFTVAGPGCKRGLSHIFPEISKAFTYENGLEYLRIKQHKYFEKYGYDYKFLDELGGKEKGIHLADIENCCCEYSKFHKAWHGYGRPRNKYVAGVLK